MALFLPLIRWFWLLFIALFMPVSLPAGGAQLELNEMRKDSKLNQVISGECCEFRIGPYDNSLVTRRVGSGIPMNIVRSLEDPQGVNWFQVKICALPLLDEIGLPNRGWVYVKRHK